MKTIIIVAVTSIGGWFGWWLGYHLNLFIALLLSMIGTGAGLYVGRRFNRMHD